MLILVVRKETARL